MQVEESPVQNHPEAVAAFMDAVNEARVQEAVMKACVHGENLDDSAVSMLLTDIQLTSIYIIFVPVHRPVSLFLTWNC